MNNKSNIATNKKQYFFLNCLRDFFLFNLQAHFEYLRGCIFTITNVVVLDGGMLLKIYFSTFSNGNKTEENILHFLNKKKKQIRFLFGKEVAKKIKYIPNLDFYIDDTKKELEKLKKYL